jgi:hypothetical protein
MGLLFDGRVNLLLDEMSPIISTLSSGVNPSSFILSIGFSPVLERVRLLMFRNLIKIKLARLKSGAFWLSSRQILVWVVLRTGSRYDNLRILTPLRTSIL